MPPLTKHIFSVNVDFSQRELLNAVLQNLFQAPLVPREGQVYYDSFYNVPHYWNETEWIPWERPVHRKYNSESAMIADQEFQLKQFIYFDGTTYWEYLGTTNGNITDYNPFGSTYVHPAYTPIDLTLTGATVFERFETDNIGSVLTATTRTLTLNDLGYSGNTGADFYGNWVLNINGLPFLVVGSEEIVNIQAGDNVTIDASGNTITISSQDTIYIHPVYTPVNLNLSGSTVLSTLVTDNIGSVLSATTRTLTPEDIGAQRKLILTTNGNSGEATLDEETNELNIPEYTLEGLGGEPAFDKGDIIIPLDSGLSYTGDTENRLVGSGDFIIVNNDKGSDQNIFKEIKDENGSVVISASTNNDFLQIEGRNGTEVSFESGNKIVIDSPIQDNIVRIYEIDVSNIDFENPVIPQVVTIINNLSIPITLTQTDSKLNIIIKDNTINKECEVIIELINKGKGTYGLGNIQITEADLLIIEDNCGLCCDNFVRVLYVPCEFIDFSLPLKPQIAAYINQMDPPLVIEKTDSKYNVIINCEEPGGGASCENGMDVLFILDYTGSMGGSISDIKNSLLSDNGFLKPIIEKSGNNYRLALAIVDEYDSGFFPDYYTNLFFDELLNNGKVYINNTPNFDQYISLIVDFSDQNVEEFKDNISKILTTTNRIACLNFNGIVNTDIITNLGFSGTINKIEIQSNDKIIIVGNFTSYNSTNINRIVRLNTNGSIDNSFTVGSGFSNTVNDIKLQADGKIIVGGVFGSYNNFLCNRIIRLNTNGNVDNTFNIGLAFNGDVKTIAIQSDGKILVGGNFTRYQTTTFNRIIRLNSNGSIDNTFSIGTGFDNIVNIIKIQSDGKILVGGSFSDYNSNLSNRIIRLNSDGSIDNTFSIGTGFDNIVNTITLEADNKILVGGDFTTYNSNNYNRIIRLNSDGTVDNTFTIGNGFNFDVNSITLQQDAKLLIGGNFTAYNSNSSNRIIRLNSDGTVDNTFTIGTGFNNEVNDIKISSDNTIFVGGSFSIYDSYKYSFLLGDGNGQSEPYDMAMDICINGTPFKGNTRSQFMQPFRSNVNKQIILICDNLPSGDDDKFDQDDIDFITQELKPSVLNNNIRFSQLTSLQFIQNSTSDRISFTEDFIFNGVRTFTLSKNIGSFISVNIITLTTTLSVPRNSVTVNYSNKTLTIADNITINLGNNIQITYYYNPLLDIVYESNGIYSVTYDPISIEDVIEVGCDGSTGGGGGTTPSPIIYEITGTGLSGNEIDACLNFNPSQKLYTFCEGIDIGCNLYYNDEGSLPVLNVRYVSINDIIYELDQTTGRIIAISSFNCNQIIETFIHTGTGFGNTAETACDDASINNKTVYSDCEIIDVGCKIFSDTNGLNLLTGFTKIYIDNEVWDINSTTATLVQVSLDQCPVPITVFTQINCGYGNSSEDACEDAQLNDRIIYSTCSLNNTGCDLFFDSDANLPLTGFTHVFIDGKVFDVDNTTGTIIEFSENQCPTSGLFTFIGCGYGNTVADSCNDSIINNRTLYSNCENIINGCELYTDSDGNFGLFGFNYVTINGTTWDLELGNIIVSLSEIQC